MATKVKHLTVLMTPDRKSIYIIPDTDTTKLKAAAFESDNPKTLSEIETLESIERANITHIDTIIDGDNNTTTMTFDNKLGRISSVKVSQWSISKNGLSYADKLRVVESLISLNPSTNNLTEGPVKQLISVIVANTLSGDKVVPSLTSVPFVQSLHIQKAVLTELIKKG